MSNFFYLGMRLKFEGFEDELQVQQREVLASLEEGSGSVGNMVQLGLVQQVQKMRGNEEFGKRMNIEVKKLIKARKVRYLDNNFSGKAVALYSSESRTHDKVLLK